MLMAEGAHSKQGTESRPASFVDMEQTVLALSTYGTRDSINKVRMRWARTRPGSGEKILSSGSG
jgi:hypothetical protein